MEVPSAHSDASRNVIPGLDGRANSDRFFVQLTDSVVLPVHEAGMAGRPHPDRKHLRDLCDIRPLAVHAPGGAELLRPRLTPDVRQD